MTLEPAPTGAGEASGSRPPGEDATPGDERARLHRAAWLQWMRRRDLERQLHDGAALRISALALRLGLLRHRRPDDEHEFQVTIDDLQSQLHEVLQELRDVAGRLYPPLLDEAGLGPALREATARSTVPVRIDANDERFGPAVEGAAYFALLGCLVGRTDGPPPVRPIEVVVRRDPDGLLVVVDGVDACHAASIHDGVHLLGGTVAVGEGPPITVRIPCA